MKDNGKAPEPAPELNNGQMMEVLMRCAALLAEVPGWQEWADRHMRLMVAGPAISQADFEKGKPRWVELHGMGEAAAKLVHHYRNLEGIVKQQRSEKE